jgi:hypothetical protein
MVILGWLLLLPLAGGLWAVSTVANASAIHGGGWRLIGAATNAAIGGGLCLIGNFLAYERFDDGSGYITFPIAGWISTIGGILIGTLGVISALTKSGAEAEMDQLAERLKSRLPYESDRFRPATNLGKSVSKTCANCGTSNWTGGRIVSGFCTKCGSAFPDIDLEVEAKSAID